MIPTAVHDVFTLIEFYAFRAFLLFVSVSWLLIHGLDTLERLIIRIRKFWIAIRRELPDAPTKVIHDGP